jgi:hypothetical protein
LGQGRRRQRRFGAARRCIDEALAQSQNLRAQLLAGERTFEADHLVAVLAGAKPSELFRLPFASEFLRHRRRGYASKGRLLLELLPFGLGLLAALRLLAEPLRVRRPRLDALAFETRKLQALLFLRAALLVLRPPLRCFALRPLPLGGGGGRSGNGRRLRPALLLFARLVFTNLVFTNLGGDAVGRLVLEAPFARERLRGEHRRRIAANEVVKHRRIARAFDLVPSLLVLLIEMVFVEQRHMGLRPLPAVRLRADVGGNPPEHDLDLEAGLPAGT